MPLIVNLTNIPAPYREKVHELVFDHFNSSYTVIYCSELEPNRKWVFPYGYYHKIFLSKGSKGYIHNNPSVWSKLNELKPEVVITTGYNPTMLYAFFWCIANSAKHICFTDGTYNSEKNLTFIHTLIRRIVFSKSVAFIGAGLGSKALYESYKIPETKIFSSNLAVNNSRFANKNQGKLYSLMFSGQFISRKMPFFFIEVARLVKIKLGKIKVLILGNGELKDEILIRLADHDIDFEYPGFLNQDELPEYYANAKIFLFPTKNDPWGIVVNEAMAAGLPVITCENAGVANDLVINDKNGYILPLDEHVWAEHIVKLLKDRELCEKFSANAVKHVQNYNHQSAAAGIIDAIDSVL